MPAVHVPARQSSSPAVPPGQRQRARQAWQQGCRLKDKGLWKEASEQFERATALEPGDALYWLNLARSRQQLGDFDAARIQARKAFDLDRKSLVACELLAHILRDLRALDEMLVCLDELDPHTTRDARWHLLKASAYLLLGRSEPLLKSGISALAITGDDSGLRREALSMMGAGFALLKRHQDAATCHRMIVDTVPLTLGSALYAAHYAAWACDWEALPDDMRRLEACIDAVQHLQDKGKAEQPSPFCLLSLTDNAQVLRWTAELASMSASLKAVPHDRTRKVPRPNGKVRIGLLSSDLHMHATCMLLVQALEHLDRSRFELCYYSSGIDDQSPMRARVKATATCWHEVQLWTDEEVARQAERDEVGVLIDLKGYTFGSRLGALAYRPAPLNVSWLGFPGSVGASFVDYIIGDSIVTPLDAQAHYSEQIAQMPHCYQPNDSTRSQPEALSREACGLPDDAFVYASFNQSYKITPDVFEAWCQVLAATPGSVLWLLVPQEDVQQRLRDAAAGYGITAERLVFAPFMNIEAHRARLPQADLFLDSFPCSGHTTASDALWAGVPVLTLMGQSFASRVAASLLHTMGLDELVCTDLDRYFQEAVRYAQEPAALRELRARVRSARSESPLFDGQRFATELGDLLMRMVDRQDAGLAPAPLAADTGNSKRAS